jgi:hypothetical protein
VSPTPGGGAGALFARQDTTLHFDTASGPIAVTVCSPRIVRVAFGASHPPEQSFVLPRAWAPAPFEITDGEVVHLATRDLRLAIDTPALRLAFADASGAWLLREPADGGMAIERAADGAARVRARFAFEGEQHFYGLGQGGGRLDRLGQARQLWAVYTSTFAPYSPEVYIGGAGIPYFWELLGAALALLLLYVYFLAATQQRMFRRTAPRA